MNLSQLPSMMDLQRQKVLQQNRFIHNQSQINKRINKAHQNNNYYVQAQQVIGLSRVNIPQSRVKFTQNHVDYHKHGKMLEQQLKLQHLENKYGLQKSRIQDQSNARTFRVRYSYGKENVRITEDVLQKYSLNTYQNQCQTLKKFEDEAKKLKLEKSSKNIKSRQIIYNDIESINLTQRRHIKKKTSILQKQRNKLQKTKIKYLKEVQKNNSMKIQENKRLDNIELILKDMRQKMNLNSSCLTEREHQRKKQEIFIKKIDFSRANVNRLHQMNQNQNIYRKKLPIVVYDKTISQRNNFVNRNVATEVQSIERNKKIQKPQQYDEILNIYSLNKQRLDRLCHRQSIKTNKSSVIY